MGPERPRSRHTEAKFKLSGRYLSRADTRPDLHHSSPCAHEHRSLPFGSALSIPVTGTETCPTQHPQHRARSSHYPFRKRCKALFFKEGKNIRTPSPAAIWAAPGRCEKPSPRVRACLLFDTQDTPSYRVCGLGSLFKIKLTPRLPSLPLLCGVELCCLLWPGSTSRLPAISRSATASGLYE